MDNMIWICIIFSVCLLCLIGVFVYHTQQFMKYFKIHDQYQYLKYRLNRYLNVSDGDINEILLWQNTHNINVNFRYFLISDEFLYLFDGNKELFAIHDRTKKSTHIFNFNTALKTINEYEKQHHGYRIKPGDVVVSPFQSLNQ